MALIALSAPWILLILVSVGLGLSVFRKRKTAIGVFLLTIAWGLYFHTFPINILHWKKKNPEAFKVMAFNCNLPEKSKDKYSRRAETAEMIKLQCPDVVFITENFAGTKDSLWLLLQDKFPYHSTRDNAVGNHLYSKYKIQNEVILKEKMYGVSYYQIQVNGQKIDIYGVHLSSNNYIDENKALHPDSVKEWDGAKQYLKDIRRASAIRQEQVSTILANVNPENRNIILGDFNDISGSKPLNMIEEAGFHDAWWKGGFGYGATIHYPLPYRIDHIFYNDRLKLKSIRKIDCKGLSDHDALVAEFDL